MTFMIFGPKSGAGVLQNSMMIESVGEPLSLKLADLQLPTGTDPVQKEFLSFIAVNRNNRNFDLTDLQRLIDDLFLKDDVCSHMALDFVLLLVSNVSNIQTNGHEPPWPVYISDVAGVPLQDGPYVIKTGTGRIYSAGCRYEDTHAAFVARHAAVRSRLYHNPTHSRPLVGLRFAVKDLVDVRDMPTTCGNQQYGQLYGRKGSTAAFVQRLLDAGAEFVGKTKTSPFADGLNSACHWYVAIGASGQSITRMYGEWPICCFGELVNTKHVCLESEKHQGVSHEKVGTAIIFLAKTDTLAPFNPRGDGFQTAGSSSTGSAVACAAYDWLDFTIGTDTGGSVRYPAAVCGVYGARLSSTFNCKESREHVMTASSTLDTVGVFARHSKILRQVSSLVVDPRYSDSILRNNARQPPTERKFRLLYPVKDLSADPKAATKWFADPRCKHQTVPNNDAGAHMEKFVERLESLLQTQRMPFDFADLWRCTHPPDLPESIDEALDLTYRDDVYYQTARNIIDPFISDWKDNFKIREPTSTEQAPEPFITPIINARAEYGRNVTDAQHKAAKHTQERFSRWAKDVLFRHFIEEGEIPLLLLPRSWGLPDYRFEDDTPDGPVFPWAGFQPPNISGFSDCPDFTVPVGEVPYQSKVTGRREWLPCSVGLLTEPGGDGLLFDLLDMFEEQGIVKPQVAGARVYGGRKPSSSSRL